MGAWEVLNLVLKTFSRFSNSQDVSELHKDFYPPDFAVQNATNFSRNLDSSPPHTPVHYCSWSNSSNGYVNMSCHAFSHRYQHF